MNVTDIASFVAVVEHGTITGAAKTEGVPKSTISRRITRLEADLGIQLLSRSSRAFAITDEGRLLHARAKGALKELEDIRQTLVEGHQEPRGTLVVTVPQDLATARFFSSLLMHYRARYPKVELEIRLESRYVDLVREGVDVALRGHGKQIPGDSSLSVKTIGNPKLGLYAHPDYLAQQGTPTTLADLAHHELVARNTNVERPMTLTSDSAVEKVSINQMAFKVNDIGCIKTLVAQGAGIGLLPVSDILETDNQTYVRVLPEWSARAGKLSLMWPTSRLLSPKVRAFIDLASELLPAALE